MVGRSVSHYRITGELGAGGMGLVYRAKDLRLEREVALKFPSPRLLNSRQTIDRFEREARAAAAINHPNICTVYEVGEHENTPYLSMELLHGETLRAKLHGTPQPIDRLLDWAIQIADALDAAHRRGIVHGDLKPSNIFVTESGSIKILDFGLAKVLRAAAGADSETVTQTLDGSAESIASNHVAGTPAYMSPEQARGEDLDARTDLFSFGIILYELATGKSPFEGKSTASTLAAVLSHTPDVPTKLQKNLPRQLDQIVGKALDKDRDTRYQSAADIRADLKRLLRDSSPSQKPKRRFPYWLLATGLLLLASMAVAIWFRTHSNGAGYIEHAEITQLTTTGEVVYAAISPDAKYVAYSTGRTRGSLRVRQIAAGTDNQLLPPGDVFYPGITFSPDSSYIYYLLGRNGTTDIELFSIPVLGGQPRSITKDVWSAPSFSPDGSKLAFQGILAGKRRLLLANLDGTEKHPIELIETGERLAAWSVPSWSPDGKLIAAALTRGSHVYVAVFPVAGGKRRIVGRSDWWKLESPAWILHGHGLVFVASLGPTPTQVWEMSYPEGIARQVTNDLAQYRKVLPSGDSSTLSAVRISAGSNIWLANRLSNGQIEPTPHRVGGGSARLGWKGVVWLDNGRLAYTMEDGRNQNLAISDPAGNHMTQLTRNEVVDDGIDAYGRNFIIYSAFDHSRPRLRKIDSEGQNSLTLASDAILPSCSPDGKWIFYTSTANLETGNGIWKVSAGGGTPVLVTAEGKRPHVSPNGQMLAYARQRSQNELVIVPASGGSPLHILRLGGVSTYTFNWAPRGEAIDFVRRDQDDDTIWRVPIAGGSPRRLLAFGSGIVWNLAWSPDGKQLAIAHGERTEDAVLIRNNPVQ
ncbi:MAG TPA: protein kinase [Bryobacteraceae bacterium]|nr:protein kinase [Bryobacteraceae bacterium]